MTFRDENKTKLLVKRKHSKDNSKDKIKCVCIIIVEDLNLTSLVFPSIDYVFIWTLDSTGATFRCSFGLCAT